MSLDGDDWILKIIPDAQAKDMEARAKKTEENMNNGVNIVFCASNDDIITLCRAYQNASLHAPSARQYIAAFVAALIKTLEQHLTEQGIDPYEKDAQ